jgi:thiol:disulfide interchange protein DsbD
LLLHAAAAVLAMGLFSCSSEPPDSRMKRDYGEGHATARLIAESTALHSGGTTLLGIAFDIEEGWHLYWDGRNDSGLPISIEPEFPPGFEIGEIQWPAPKRLVSPGAILDHVYEGNVTLIIPVHVPPDAPADSHVTLRCQVYWIACSEMCVPGESRIELALPIAPPDEAPRRADTAELIERALSRSPVPLSADADGVRFSWDGHVLDIEVAGARGLTFYPHADCTQLLNPIMDAASKSGRLRLRFVEAAEEPVRASGVMEINAGRGRGTRIHAIDLRREPGL